MSEDPLVLLREYASHGKMAEVMEQDGSIRFGDQASVSKDAPTKLRRTKAGARRSDGTKEYFTIGSLVFFMKQPPQNFSGYMKQAIAAGYQAVSLLDRNSIREYLEGKIDTLDAIETAEPILPVTRRETIEQVKPLAADKSVSLDASGTPSEMLAMIRARERPLSNLEKSMYSTLKSFASIYVLRNALNKNHHPVPQAKAEAKYVSKYDRTLVNEETRRKKLGEALGGIDVKGSFGFQSSAVAEVHAPPSQAAKAARISEKPHAQAKPPRGSRRPIILVPPGFSTLLNMYNVKEFLESGRYEASKTKQQGGEKKQDVIIISRNFGRDAPVSYEVTDRSPNPRSPRHKDFWSRVVCAFVTGAKWQMTDWPFKGIEQGNMVDTFAHIKGFHLKYDTDTIAPIIQSWDVTVLNLDKNNRHKDQALVQEFWTTLDKFIGRRHAHLRY